MCVCVCVCVTYGFYFVWILFCRTKYNWFTNEDKRGFSRPMRVLHVGKYMLLQLRGCMFDIYLYVCRSQKGRVRFRLS